MLLIKWFGESSDVFGFRKSRGGVIQNWKFICSVGENPGILFEFAFASQRNLRRANRN